MAKYHDEEWGVPQDDDHVHFELLTLEGAQAGLSWLTVLKRRDGYRQAFSDFDPVRVSKYTPAKVEKLMEDPGIIRHRLKVESTITNAKAFIEVQSEFGSFDGFLTQQIPDRPIHNSWSSVGELPASTSMSDALSRQLRKRGFRFVGSTIVYSYLQAVGVINDHTTSCFRYEELSRA